MLAAVDLTKRFEDGFLALDHLNLTVRDGEWFCLLGANGAGKSTTIHLFLNLVSPSGGAAFVDGIEVAKDPLGARERVSYVSAQTVHYGSLTARQNVEFFAGLGGRDRLAREEIYMALRRVGLQEKAFEQQVKLLSSGMRQKVAIAAAMLTDAPNLLLDEPTAGLDPTSGAELMEVLHELRTEGKAILMCTHDIFRAREYASHVGIMKEGRLVMVRSRDALAGEDLEQLYMDYMLIS